MDDSGFLKVQLPTAEILFILGAGDDPATIENVDAEVLLDDGSRWSATFLSYAEIGRIMTRWESTGESLSGAYFRCPDLIVVRAGGIEGMVEVLRAIIATGEPSSGLVRIDIEE